jgi:hypothetical protein
MDKPTEEVTMNSYTENGSMEFGEMVLRGGVGMIMLETVLLTPALSPALIAGFSLGALYLVFTAIIGRDPVYALAKRSHRHEEAKVSVTPAVTPIRVRVARDYKKAA